MSKEDIREIVRRLHQEVGQTQELDPPSIEALRSIMGEIQELLDKQQEDAESSTLSERLSNWISQLEARHPQLTSLLSQVTDRLSDMGI